MRSLWIIFLTFLCVNCIYLNCFARRKGGTAIAKIVGLNAERCYFFETLVKMYVYEESYNNERLVDIINQTHINEKYLPGVKLPNNIIADSDLRLVVENANILVFV